MTNLTIKELQDFNNSQREIIEKQQEEIKRLREADVLMVAQFESQEREITMLRGLLRDVMTDFDGYLGESLTRRVREALSE